MSLGTNRFSCSDCFLPSFWGARMDGDCCSLKGVEAGVAEAPGGGCDDD